MNIALNKKILEVTSWKSSELLTDGNSIFYDGKSGFGHTLFPNYCTLDLDGIHDIKLIRFLLWDKDHRTYKYRLLTSLDMNTWTVHYDTGEYSTRSWQNFEFTNKTKVRYIRIHALWNSINIGFHIVQIEAYEDGIIIPAGEEVRIIRSDPETITNEVSDGLLISKKMKQIANTIREMPSKFSSLDKEYFTLIASELETNIFDIERIEKGMEAIRRQIIDPVNKELTVSNKIGRLSIYLGLIGGVIGIFSLINSIFKWIG